MPQQPKYSIPHMESIVKAIGLNITRIRKSKGLTQQEVADAVGISQRLLSHFEVGRRRITAEMIVQIAKVLNTSSDLILGLKNGESMGTTISHSLAKRMHEIENLPLSEKRALVKTIDNFLKVNRRTM